MSRDFPPLPRGEGLALAIAGRGAGREIAAEGSALALSRGEKGKAALLAVLFSVFMASAHAQAPLAPPGLPANSFPAPARPVASIISDRWASEDQRERVGESAKVMEFLQIRPGMAVADIGAGSGYYVARLSPRVGPAGRVLAQDITPSYLAALQRRVQREGLDNVSVSLGDAHDPRLPPNSVDVALLVHMYHEIGQPFGLLYNLLPALRPGARVAILDTTRPTQQHGTPPALLDCELEAVGYKRVATLPLENGAEYLAVFEPPATPPDPAGIRPCQP